MWQGHTGALYRRNIFRLLSATFITVARALLMIVSDLRVVLSKEAHSSRQQGLFVDIHANQYKDETSTFHGLPLAAPDSQLPHACP